MQTHAPQNLRQHTLNPSCCVYSSRGWPTSNNPTAQSRLQIFNMDFSDIIYIYIIIYIINIYYWLLLDFLGLSPTNHLLGNLNYIISTYASVDLHIFILSREPKITLMLRFPEAAHGCHMMPHDARTWQVFIGLRRFGSADVQLLSILLHSVLNPQGARVPCFFVSCVPVSLLVRGMTWEDHGR